MGLQAKEKFWIEKSIGEKMVKMLIVNREPTEFR
jgi:hypothetical protein